MHSSVEGRIHADQNALAREPTAEYARRVRLLHMTRVLHMTQVLQMTPGELIQACSCMLHLNGELLLLTPESSPNIGLQSAWGSFLKQPHQQGIAGRPCQVLGELLEQDCQVIMHAHHTGLCLGLLSER